MLAILRKSPTSRGVDVRNSRSCRLDAAIRRHAANHGVIREAHSWTNLVKRD
jgi:hypothetical protein